jgi:hypothetical protein
MAVQTALGPGERSNGSESMKTAIKFEAVMKAALMGNAAQAARA